MTQSSQHSQVDLSAAFARLVVELRQLIRGVGSWQNEPKFDSDFNRRSKINRGKWPIAFRV